MKSIIVFSVVCLAAWPCMGQCLHGHHAQGVCCPECKTEPNEKSCYCVECEKICIPAVKFPWESCCVRKPGKVRVVRKLTKKDYECGQKVVWEWPKPEKVPCCTSGHGCACGQAGCDGCCDVGCAVTDGCTSAGCAVIEAPVPPAVPVAPEVEVAPTPAAEALLPPTNSLGDRARGMFRMDF